MKKISLVILLLIGLHCIGQNIPANGSLDSMKQLTVQYRDAGRYEDALKVYYQIIHIGEKSKDICLLCEAYCEMISIHDITKNKSGITESIEKAEGFCNACTKPKRMARFLGLKARHYAETQRLDSAIILFQSSADIYYKNHDTLKALNVLGQLGNVYELKNQPKLATPYYLKHYQYAFQSGDTLAMFKSSMRLTNNYISLENGPKALELANQAENLAIKLNFTFELGAIKEYKALGYYYNKDYKKSAEEMKAYADFYKDTVVNAQRIEIMEEMKAKFETEKKEQLLQFQNQQLESQRTKLWLTGILLLLSLTAGWYFYRLNQLLKKRNAEKTYLVQEMHHRVKNNLQVLSSLLHLQSKYLSDLQVKDALREGQNRVDAMGLIHQKLYLGEDVTSVEMKDYLENLSHSIMDTFGMQDRIQIEVAMPSLHLDADRAIPIGLIVNELITNALKYGFPEESKGKITIQLKEHSSSQLQLIVEDNGIGLKEQTDIQSSRSFGLQLIEMLSKKWNGVIETFSAHGVKTTITFNKMK